MINRDELLKMAREAGFCMDCDWRAASDYLCDERDIISFANAILERAAVECETFAVKKTRVMDEEKACMKAAKAIRALKTQGE